MEDSSGGMRGQGPGGGSKSWAQHLAQDLGVGKGEKQEEEVLKEGEVGAWGSEEDQDEGIWEIGKKLREARGEERVRKPMVEERKRWEVREGDWTCKAPECRNWSNFRWRKNCLKCGGNQDGNKISRAVVEKEEDLRSRSQVTHGQSPRERLRRRLEDPIREPIRRPPRMIILTINVTIEGKTRTRPHLADHYDIMRQAGLNIEEVTGKVGKPGYLEVALTPGSASVAKALREGHKEVNSKITITSVRERGSNRVVVLRWQEVPFEVLDETLIQYTELFGKPERVGRSLRWETVKEEDDTSPGGMMTGKWSGERSLPVTLNRDIAHIPTWHYVGGGRLRLQVPGRKNCPRCLKSVGECRGGGAWGKCEASLVPAGDWKIEQEKFLESLGWGEKKQKIMEGLEQKEAMETLVGDEEEIEIRTKEEQKEKEEEEKEGLVQELEAEKVCSGLILRNFPDVTKDRKKEKKEALWMVIVASNLFDSEEERLGEAEVAVSRRDRGGKLVIDVKITLEGEDALLRKVWTQLEKACNQDKVKRYQVEAATPMTPPKEKTPTEFQKARQKVRQIISKEEARQAQEKQEQKRTEEGLEKLKTRELDNAESLETFQKGIVSWDCHDRGFWLRELVLDQKENAQNIDVAPPGEIDKQDTDYITEDEDVDIVAVEQNENQGSVKTSRTKVPLWKAPEGKRRCGLGCTGCEAKCAEQGLTDCWGCWMNTLESEKAGRKVKKKECFNRQPCLDIRPKKQPKAGAGVESSSGKDQDQISRSRSKSTTSGGRKMSRLSVATSKEKLSDTASRSPVSREVVGSQVVVLKPGLVSQIGDALEASGNDQNQEVEQAKKRSREESGKTPEKEQEKPVAKATKTTATGSKIAQPVKGGSVVRGEKPPTTNL